MQLGIYSVIPRTSPIAAMCAPVRDKMTYDVQNERQLQREVREDQRELRS